MFPDLAAAARVPCFGDAIVVGGPNQRWFRGFEGDHQREERILEASEQVQASGLSTALLDGGYEGEGNGRAFESADAPSTPPRDIPADHNAPLSPIRTPSTPSFQLVPTSFLMGSEEDDDEDKDEEDEDASLCALL
jgi:hypothetical protein